MRNYFYKITTFDIDGPRLYKEWLEVATKFDMFNRSNSFVPTRSIGTQPYYLKLMINYPSPIGPQMDPVWIPFCDTNAGEDQPDELYSLSNIINDFQGTYTEQVAHEVGSYIQNRYKEYKLTKVKYASLAPNSLITPHTDGTVEPRFFLTVNAPKGTYMKIFEERYTYEEVGSLFRLNVRGQHSPINESDDYRVMMAFDVVKS